VFFSLDFKWLALPLVAHSEWDAGKTETGGSPNLHLWICSSQDQLPQLLSQARENLTELSRLGAELPATTNQQHLIELTGDAGGSLAAMLAEMAKAGAKVEAFVPPELGGFWSPPPSGPRGDGILVWADKDGSYHVAVCRSKSQASTIIRNFDWMPGSRRENLLTSISGWNACPNSNIQAQIIDGQVAELFYHASIWGKYKGAKRRSMN
jgi:hypothetical protein